MIDRITELLGDRASLLDYRCTGIASDQLHLPGPDFVDRVMAHTDRSPQVLRSLQTLFDHGRAAGTGYVSILPVDQGIEHSGAASFAPNPVYFDPANIVELAVEGGCNGVASTLGVLGSVSRRYAHKIPFIVKINHNEILTYPNHYDQTLFASVEQAWDLGAVGVGATIYYGSEACRRQIMEVSEAFQQAHELGMITILWCYLRNPAFKHEGTDYHASADLTGQANHLGVTIEADIVKQKQPTNNGGYTALKFGKTHPLVYEKLVPDHPIELTRWQVANCYMGRVGLINSGGASGSNDLAQAVTTAVVNKRAGGMGLISGRKAFQKPMADGVKLLNAIQDVFACPEVTIA
ncbi:MAG: class I fructose-bisphosphate aldolase, partial [Thermoanaerobaculales bacterium]|nr:class I fructose-bisphosphate aldolase [Thermoanaerobaculales bacterium]